jgi:hypothetical protein
LENTPGLLRSFDSRFARLVSVIARRRRQAKITLVARIRRWLQKIKPYLSLVLLLIPLLLVEPLKVVALVIAGKGHWLTGTGMLILSYGASLLIVERLFRLVKPRLMMMHWFAKLWAGFVTLRTEVFGGSSDKHK